MENNESSGREESGGAIDRVPGWLVYGLITGVLALSTDLALGTHLTTVQGPFGYTEFLWSPGMMVAMLAFVIYMVDFVTWDTIGGMAR